MIDEEFEDIIKDIGKNAFKLLEVLNSGDTGICLEYLKLNRKYVVSGSANIDELVQALSERKLIESSRSGSYRLSDKGRTLLTYGWRMQGYQVGEENRILFRIDRPVA